MKCIFCMITILLFALNSKSQEMCGSLFIGDYQDLAGMFGVQNAENSLQLFSAQMQLILSNMKLAQESKNPKTIEVLKALRSAAMVDGMIAKMIGPERMKIHMGKIEKSAEALIKLDLLFDGDLLKNAIKENKNMILAARRSLVVIGLRRFLELQGVQIVDHWDFSGPRAFYKTMWHDLLKPTVKIFLTMNPSRRSQFTEEQAQRVLWMGLNDASKLKWAAQDELINFRENWILWSEMYPRVVAKWTLFAVSVGFLVGSGMIYKSYLQSDIENIADYADRKISMESVVRSVRQDTANSLLQDVIEIYKERNKGQDPSAEYVEITKKKIRTRFPDAVFEDEK